MSPKSLPVSISARVTVTVALTSSGMPLYSRYAVITAVPAPFAVTTPPATDATASCELFQRITAESSVSPRQPVKTSAVRVKVSPVLSEAVLCEILISGSKVSVFSAGSAKQNALDSVVLPILNRLSLALPAAVTRSTIHSPSVACSTGLPSRS